MRLNSFDAYIHMSDCWENISTYNVEKQTNTKIILAPTSSCLSKKELREIPIKEGGKLQIFPFSIYTSDKYLRLARVMWRVKDLVCTLLRKYKSMQLKDLTQQLLKYKERYKFEGAEQVEWTLRCLSARGVIIPKKVDNSVSFSISPTFKTIEKERLFSATIAKELESLSERVKYIVDHGPSVGTYRENILKTTLRKHLPERYHVATGFILGLKRQIDILIYDRVDYAPVFREEDLVIVSPESVRAVIEVKTTLTIAGLNSALELLDDVSLFDDNSPPFFKGIFAFESKLSEKSLYNKVADFYTDWLTQSQGGPGVLICNPFQFLTCICVNKKAFAYTEYNQAQNERLVPILYSKQSITELKNQTSFFIQSLLSYLKFGGMKAFKPDFITRMLGEDTLKQKIKELRDDEWGAYFKYDNGDAEKSEVGEMESSIITTQSWLDGENNYETISASSSTLE